MSDPFSTDESPFNRDYAELASKNPIISQPDADFAATGAAMREELEQKKLQERQSLINDTPDNSVAMSQNFDDAARQDDQLMSDLADRLGFGGADVAEKATKARSHLIMADADAKNITDAELLRQRDSVDANDVVAGTLASPIKGFALSANRGAAGILGMVGLQDQSDWFSENAKAVDYMIDTDQYRRDHPLLSGVAEGVGQLAEVAAETIATGGLARVLGGTAMAIRASRALKAGETLAEGLTTTSKLSAARLAMNGETALDLALAGKRAEGTAAGVFNLADNVDSLARVAKQLPTLSAVGQEYNDAWEQMKDDPDYANATEAEKRALAATYGIGAGILERGSDLFMMSTLGRAFKKAGKSATTNLLDAAGDAGEKLVTKKIWNSAALASAGSATKLIGSTLATSAMEGGTEGVQRAFQNIVLGNELMEGVAEEAAVGAILGGGVGLGGHAMAMTKKLQQEDTLPETAAALNALVKSSGIDAPVATPSRNAFTSAPAEGTLPLDGQIDLMKAESAKALNEAWVNQARVAIDGREVTYMKDGKEVDRSAFGDPILGDNTNLESMNGATMHYKDDGSPVVQGKGTVPVSITPAAPMIPVEDVQRDLDTILNDNTLTEEEKHEDIARIYSGAHARASVDPRYKPHYQAAERVAAHIQLSQIQSAAQKDRGYDKAETIMPGDADLTRTRIEETLQGGGLARATSLTKAGNRKFHEIKSSDDAGVTLTDGSTRSWADLATQRVSVAPKIKKSITGFSNVEATTDWTGKDPAGHIAESFKAGKTMMVERKGKAPSTVRTTTPSGVKLASGEVMSWDQVKQSTLYTATNEGGDRQAANHTRAGFRDHAPMGDKGDSRERVRKMTALEQNDVYNPTNFVNNMIADKGLKGATARILKGSPMLKGLKVIVKPMGVRKDGRAKAGNYDPITHTVTINLDASDRYVDADGNHDVLATALHELNHAALQHVLASDTLTKEQQGWVDILEEGMTYFDEQTKNTQDAAVKELRAKILKSDAPLAEFIAEVHNSPAMQEILKAGVTNEGSFFTRLMRAILNLISGKAVNKHSQLAKVWVASNDLAKSADPTSRNAKANLASEGEGFTGSETDANGDVDVMDEDLGVDNAETDKGIVDAFAPGMSQRELGGKAALAASAIEDGDTIKQNQIRDAWEEAISAETNPRQQMDERVDARQAIASFHAKKIDKILGRDTNIKDQLLRMTAVKGVDNDFAPTDDQSLQAKAVRDSMEESLINYGMPKPAATAIANRAYKMLDETKNLEKTMERIEAAMENLDLDEYAIEGMKNAVRTARPTATDAASELTDEEYLKVKDQMKAALSAIREVAKPAPMRAAPPLPAAIDGERYDRVKAALENPKTKEASKAAIRASLEEMETQQVQRTKLLTILGNKIQGKPFTEVTMARWLGDAVTRRTAHIEPAMIELNRRINPNSYYQAMVAGTGAVDVQKISYNLRRMLLDKMSVAERKRASREELPMIIGLVEGPENAKAMLKDKNLDWAHIQVLENVQRPEWVTDQTKRYEAVRGSTLFDDEGGRYPWFRGNDEVMKELIKAEDTIRRLDRNSEEPSQELRNAKADLKRYTKQLTAQEAWLDKYVKNLDTLQQRLTMGDPDVILKAIEGSVWGNTPQEYRASVGNLPAGSVRQFADRLASFRSTYISGNHPRDVARFLFEGNDLYNRKASEIRPVSTIELTDKGQELYDKAKAELEGAVMSFSKSYLTVGGLMEAATDFHGAIDSIYSQSLGLQYRLSAKAYAVLKGKAKTGRAEMGTAEELKYRAGEQGRMFRDFDRANTTRNDLIEAAKAAPLSATQVRALVNGATMTQALEEANVTIKLGGKNVTGRLMDLTYDQMVAWVDSVKGGIDAQINSGFSFVYKAPTEENIRDNVNKAIRLLAVERVLQGEQLVKTAPELLRADFDGNKIGWTLDQTARTVRDELNTSRGKWTKKDKGGKESVVPATELEEKDALGKRDALDKLIAQHQEAPLSDREYAIRLKNILGSEYKGAIMREHHANVGNKKASKSALQRLIKVAEMTEAGRFGVSAKQMTTMSKMYDAIAAPLDMDGLNDADRKAALKAQNQEIKDFTDVILGLTDKYDARALDADSVTGDPKDERIYDYAVDGDSLTYLLSTGSTPKRIHDPIARRATEEVWAIIDALPENIGKESSLVELDSMSPRKVREAINFKLTELGNYIAKKWGSVPQVIDYSNVSSTKALLQALPATDKDSEARPALTKLLNRLLGGSIPNEPWGRSLQEWLDGAPDTRGNYMEEFLRANIVRATYNEAKDARSFTQEQRGEIEALVEKGAREVAKGKKASEALTKGKKDSESDMLFRWLGKDLASKVVNSNYSLDVLTPILDRYTAVPNKPDGSDFAYNDKGYAFGQGMEAETDVDGRPTADTQQGRMQGPDQYAALAEQSRKDRLARDASLTDEESEARASTARGPGRVTMSDAPSLPWMTPPTREELAKPGKEAAKQAENISRQLGRRATEAMKREDKRQWMSNEWGDLVSDEDIINYAEGLGSWGFAAKYREQTQKGNTASATVLRNVVGKARWAGILAPIEAHQNAKNAITNLVAEHTDRVQREFNKLLAAGADAAQLGRQANEFLGMFNRALTNEDLRQVSLIFAGLWPGQTAAKGDWRAAAAEVSDRHIAANEAAQILAGQELQQNAPKLFEILEKIRAELKMVAVQPGSTFDMGSLQFQVSPSGLTGLLRPSFRGKETTGIPDEELDASPEDKDGALNPNRELSAMGNRGALGVAQSKGAKAVDEYFDALAPEVVERAKAALFEMNVTFDLNREMARLKPEEQTLAKWNEKRQAISRRNPRYEAKAKETLWNALRASARNVEDVDLWTSVFAKNPDEAQNLKVANSVLPEALRAVVGGDSTPLAFTMAAMDSITQQAAKAQLAQTLVLGGQIKTQAAAGLVAIPQEIVDVLGRAGYANKDVIEALREALVHSTPNKAMQTMAQVSAAAHMAATAGNLAGAVKQQLSGVIFSMNAGMLSPGAINYGRKLAARAIMRDVFGSQEPLPPLPAGLEKMYSSPEAFLQTLNSLGLRDSEVGASMRAAQLSDTLNKKDLEIAMTRAMEGDFTFMEKAGVKGAKLKKVAAAFFQYGDNIWKQSLFQSAVMEELSDQSVFDADGGLAAETIRRIEDTAAEYVRTRLPTMTRVTGATNLLRRGMLASFVSFVDQAWQITTRSPIHDVQTLMGKSDLMMGTGNYAIDGVVRQPTPHMQQKYRVRAMKALVAQAAFASVPFVLPALSRALGVDDEEQKEIRSLLPDYAKDSASLIFMRFPDGSVRTMETNWMWYQMVPMQPLFSAGTAYGASSLTKTGGEATWDATKTWIQEAVLSQAALQLGPAAIVEALQNKKGTGSEIVNPEADLMTQITKRTLHAAQTWVPGSIKPLLPGKGAWTGTDKYGTEVSQAHAAMRVFLPTWMPEMDVERAATAKIYEAFKRIDNANRLVRSAAGNDPTEEGVMDATMRADEIYREVGTSLPWVAQALMRNGSTESEIMKKFATAGIPPYVGKAALRGEASGYIPNKKSFDKIKERTEVNVFDWIFKNEGPDDIFKR